MEKIHFIFENIQDSQSFGLLLLVVGKWSAQLWTEWLAEVLSPFLTLLGVIRWPQHAVQRSSSLNQELLLCYKDMKCFGFWKKNIRKGHEHALCKGEGRYQKYFLLLLEAAVPLLLGMITMWALDLAGATFYNSKSMLGLLLFLFLLLLFLEKTEP